jgi:hypothetical protein
MWELRDRYEWLIPPRSVVELPATARIRRRILAAVLPILGDLLQQAYVVRNARAGDVIYAADQQSAVGLALLRRLRLLRVPLVVMIHNGPRFAWTRWCYRGADQLLCLSDGIRARIVTQFGVPASSVLVMPWGPSLESPFYGHYERMSRPDLDFVAAGKTNRDYRALEAVAAAEKRTGVIFGPAGVTTFVDGTATTRAGLADYDEVLTAMERARWIVVPLDDVVRLSGLTEVADAIALRAPTAVSPSPIFPMTTDAFPVFADLTTEAGVSRLLASEPPPAASVDEARSRFSMAPFARVLAEVFARVVS